MEDHVLPVQMELGFCANVFKDLLEIYANSPLLRVSLISILKLILWSIVV